MKLDPEEQRRGYLWFGVAGTVAVLLCLFLYSTNNRLEYSNSEQVKGATLKELRSAQANLSSKADDPRQYHAIPAQDEDAERASLRVELPNDSDTAQTE